MEKKMVELFAGVGGFRLGMERLHSGWETVWFSQWEPGKKKQWAHECYVSHFGDCKDLNGEYHTGEDISLMNKENIPDHSLLVGGFPCLTSDTLVWTDSGLKELGSVSVNDKVLTHDGQYKKVLNFFNQGDKEVFRLKGYGFDFLEATGNHKFFMCKRYYTYNNRKRIKHFSAPEWTSVDEMLNEKKLKDCYLGVPVNQNSVLPDWQGIEMHVNATLTITKNDLNMKSKSLWYIVGCYLGDGWLKKQYKKGQFRQEYTGVIISCNETKLEKLKEKVSEEFKYGVSEEKGLYKVIFSSTELAVFLSQFGHYADGKFIPGFVFDMPVEYIRALLDGYIASDGSIFNNLISFSTVSRKLAYGTALLFEKVYHLPCQIHLNKTPNQTTIEGRNVNQKDFYILRCRLKTVHQSAFYEDGYIWYPLKKIEKSGIKPVYDIEVEDSHSFVANRAICHNCQDFSIAHSLSTAKGIEGKKGVLWWQIRDVISAKKPFFCMFENVDRLLKSPAKQRGRDFSIILACLRDFGYSAEWRVVNAAEYGAAQRRRRTFIFAYRNDTKYGFQMSEKDVQSLLQTDGFMARAFPILTMTEIKETVLPDDIKEVSDSFAFPFSKTGYMTQGHIYTADITADELSPIMLGDILESDVDESFYIPEEKLPKWEYLKGAKKIARTSKTGHKYIYSEGPVVFPDPLDRPGRTMLTSESTLNRSTHVVADKDTKKLRTLTPVEAERLQGFDDGWTDTGMPNRMRYFCMGNALVVPMITRMGFVLDKLLESE